MPLPKKPARPRWKRLAASLAAATVVMGSGTVALTQLHYLIGERVVQVVDGDTFFIANRQAIRLFGLDAPELGNCLADKAKTELSKLIYHKRIFLREPLADKTGRVMALVYVDGKLVNEILVREGLAEYLRQGESETPALKAANDYARSQHLGIFSSLCSQTQPPDPKCDIKGNYDAHQAKNIYFLPNCANYVQVEIKKYQGDRWFCTEKEAVSAGFTKSPTCR